MWFTMVGPHGQKEYGFYCRSRKCPGELGISITIWTKSGKKNKIKRKGQ